MQIFVKRIVRDALFGLRRYKRFNNANGNGTTTFPVPIINSCTKITPINKITITTQAVLGVSLLVSFIKKKNDEEDEDAVLRRADDLYESHKYSDCYLLLINSKETNEENKVEKLWRICRVMYTLSREPTYDEGFKKRLIFKAYEIISEELQKNWNHYAVHKWYAVLLDAKSSFEGLYERVNQFEIVKNHMDLAITINPNDASTLHMLGEFCFQLADMSWVHRKIAEFFFPALPNSTYEDALEYFLRAEEARPRFFCPNLLRIGVCYMRLNKDEQAKYYMELAAAYPCNRNDDHSAKKEASDLLKRLKSDRCGKSDEIHSRFKLDFGDT